MCPTIDDLPIEEHNKWALDQKDKTRIQLREDRQVVRPAQIDVTEPAHPALALFTGEDQINQPWALIDLPPSALTARRTDLFSTSFIPRIENIEAIAERVRTLPATVTLPKQAPGAMKWEQEKEQIQYDTERGVMQRLVDTLASRSKDLDAINAERYRYHKG